MFRFLEELAYRVRLSQGCLIAQLHERSVTSVHYSTDRGLRGRRAKAGSSLPPEVLRRMRARKPRTCAPDEIRELFRARCDRLLQHFDFDYADVIAQIVRGAVVQLTFSVTVRPTEREIALLARLFSRAACDPGRYCETVSGRTATARPEVFPITKRLNREAQITNP